MKTPAPFSPGQNTLSRLLSASCGGGVAVASAAPSSTTSGGSSASPSGPAPGGRVHSPGGLSSRRRTNTGWRSWPAAVTSV